MIDKNELESLVKNTNLGLIKNDGDKPTLKQLRDKISELNVGIKPNDIDLYIIKDGLCKIIPKLDNDQLNFRDKSINSIINKEICSCINKKDLGVITE